MTTPESAAARELARQLLERETAGATEAASLGAAMQQACTQVSENLRRTVGNEGCRALLSRALARTELHQPLLKHIHRSDASGIHLEVVPAVEGHGVATVKAALLSLFAALVDILCDLVGVDMVRYLVISDYSSPAGGRRTAR
jgi:hypothetical protein